MDFSKILEKLLEGYRESFLYSMTIGTGLTETGIEEKIEELFQLQVILTSMYKIEQSLYSFERIIIH